MQCSVIISAVQFKECLGLQILGEPAPFSGSQVIIHREHAFPISLRAWSRYGVFC